MADVGTLLMKVKADDSGFQTSMAAVSSTVGNVAKAVGVASVAIVGSLTAIGVASVKTAAEFEAEMSTVQAVTMSTAEDMVAMEEAAKELGRTTAFSAAEAAEGMKFLGMAGFETSEIIEAMPGLLDLAAASGTDLGRTADIVSDALSAFGLEAEDTARFADILAVTTASANTNVEMLGESFKFAAPVAGAMGFSIEDVATSLGIMANSGIKASQAGTSLRTIMTNIATAADSTTSGLSAFGIELKNADGTLKDLSEILSLARVEFSKMTEAEQAAAAEFIAGKNAMSGFLTLVNASTTEVNDLSGAIEHADGAASDMADTMLNNLNGQVTLLKSALNGVAIEIGEQFLPEITTAVSYITEHVVPSLGDFAEKAVELAFEIGDFLAPKIEAVANFVRDNYPAMKETAITVFDAVKMGAEAVWQFVQDNLLPIFTNLTGYVEENFPLMQETIESVFSSSKIIIEDLWEFIDTNFMPIVAEMITQAEEDFPKFLVAVDQTFSAAADIITTVTDAIQKAIDIYEKFNNLLPESARTTAADFTPKGLLKNFGLLQEERRFNEETGQLETIDPFTGEVRDVEQITDPLGAGGGAFSTGGGGGSFSNNVTVNVTGTDPDETAQRVVDILNQQGVGR